MKYQKAYLEKFPDQIEFAIKNYVRHNLSVDDYNNIVLCGLGGSGIAGRIVKSYFQNSSSIPIEVISEYKLPVYVGETSLVILCSYSGNTEETLSMYIDAVEQNAKVLVLTTGGLLYDLAAENNIQCYMAEKGFQPRMALGYSLTYLLLIFSELLSQNLQNNIKGFVEHLRNNDMYLSKAKSLFESINKEINKKFVIITDSHTYPVGLRFAQQINENAKSEAFVLELPEVNHNVIESYYSDLNSTFIFLNSQQNDRVNLRFEFLANLMKSLKQNVKEIKLSGFSLKEIFDTIYTLDWLSLMVSDAGKVKSDEIPNINDLKKFLKDK